MALRRVQAHLDRDLAHLASGARDCFLFDYGLASRADWLARLAALAPRSDVAVVAVTAQFVFVVACDRFVPRIAAARAAIAARVLVDISAGIPAPRVLGDGDAARHAAAVDGIAALAQRVAAAAPVPKTYTEIAVPEDLRVHLTGLTGLLLGYPVLYCQLDDTGRNCLGMVPLRLYEWYARDRRGRRKPLLAFSCPASIADEIALDPAIPGLPDSVDADVEVRTVELMQVAT